MNRLTIFFLILILKTIIAPPVSQTTQKPNEEESEIGGLEDYMEYHRYLKEVVNALESDPEFRKKLEAAEENDIRSGKIAEELEFVSHHVRTRLDEIKRVELQRLKELTEKQRQLMNGESLDDPNHGHLDHKNPHTFEIDDLKKLIAKTTEDLAEADRRRKEEFKQYELQKEYEKQRKLNETDGAERERLEKEFKEQEEKHKKHEKLHEPGHKAQLEEVWEEQDQMQQEFDAKTFFMLHDLDGNGLWDQDEVKALFVKELQKMYEEGHPEDDMRERAEEMERMREAVFAEVDVNKDGFIDYHEFIEQTKRNEFQQDHGWQGLDEKKPYTKEELDEYVRQHEMRMRQQGYHPPPNGMPPQYPPPGQMHPGQVPQVQYHQGQVPPQYHQGQMPPGQYHQGQVPQAQYHQGQVPPQGQYQQGQVPQAQYHPGQAPPQGHVPQGQYHQGQVPPQGQVPSQNQYHQGQVPPQGQAPPQGQYHQGQVPPQGQAPPQGQYHQGQMPPQGQAPPQGQYQQGQVPPQQIQHPPQNQVPPQGQQNPPQYNQAHLPDLNTNEIYPNQQHNANNPPVANQQQGNNQPVNGQNHQEPVNSNPNPNVQHNKESIQVNQV